MSEQSDASEARNRNVGADLVIPVAAVLFTLYYFSTIIDSPWTAQVSAFFIGTILLALCGVYILRHVVTLVRREGDFGFSNLFGISDIYNGRIALFVLTVLYTIVIDYGGFTITTFFFLFLSMLVLNKGRNKTGIFITSSIMALGGWALFIYAFETRFPRGPFENMMRTILGQG